MRTGGRGLTLVVSAVLAVVSGLGLLALGGGARGLGAPDLTATVQVTPFPLPAGFGVDPETVAGALAAILQKRVDGDVSLRMTLGEQGAKRLQEIVLPRMLNVTAVRALMSEVKQLSDMVALGSFRRAALIEVANAGPEKTDVALTLPGAALAEAASGSATIATRTGDLPVVELGTMAAGERRQITVWLDARSEDPGFARSVLLGAEGGVRGKVYLSGTRPGWTGAELEVVPWARWAVGGVLLSGFLAGIAALFVTLRTRRLSRA